MLVSGIYVGPKAVDCQYEQVAVCALQVIVKSAPRSIDALALLCSSLLEAFMANGLYLRRKRDMLLFFSLLMLITAGYLACSSSSVY